MRLSEIESGGGFVDTTLIAKTGKWDRVDPETGETISTEETFFVRRVSHSQFRRVQKGITDTGEEVNPESLTVAACIRIGKTGEEALTYDQAERLDFGLFAMFIQAIGEVYEKKASSPKTSSGASSSKRASADARSEKPKTT